MNIQASVGRREGRNSQNRVADQETIQSLLNRIPVNQGGAGGGLAERFVDGVCSDALYIAIVRFQQMHSGISADGHVDPNGPTLAMLNRLADGATQHRPAIQVGAAAPRAALRPPQSNAGPGDGGVVLNEPAARQRAAWRNLVSEVRQRLQGNPNLGAVMAYLTRLEQNGLAITTTVVFGNAFVNNDLGMQNARTLRRGDRVGTMDDIHVVLLMPGLDGNAGGLIQLGPHTVYVLLGRYSGQERPRETARDTALATGALRDRDNLARLAGLTPPLRQNQ